MSDLKSTINQDVKTALKARDSLKSTTLRLILSAIKQIEVDKRIELNDDDILGILNKMLKQRQDSIQQFTDAGRDDLVAKEQQEVDIIKHYLPEALSDDEVLVILKDTIAETGASSMKDMGTVMNSLRPKIQGRYDMAKISQLVKEQLAG